MNLHIVGQVTEDLFTDDLITICRKGMFILKRTTADEFFIGRTKLATGFFEQMVEKKIVKDFRGYRTNDDPYEQTLSPYLRELHSMINEEYWVERGLPMMKIHTSVMTFLLIKHGLTGHYEISANDLNVFLFGMAICNNQDLLDGWVYQNWEKCKQNLKVGHDIELSWIDQMREARSRDKF